VSAAGPKTLAAGQLVAGPGTYKGMAVIAGAAATVTLYDNTAGSGTIVAVAQLAGAGTVIDTPAGEDGVFFQTGLFAVLTGAPTGTVRI
jgi:hypothetical protein